MFYRVHRFLERLSWRLGPVHSAPVFVLGNQKSGTTVIAALLAKYMGEEPMLDIFFRLGDFGVEDRLFGGTLEFSKFVAAHRRFFRYGVVKDPSFTFFYPDLRDVFPDGRYVFIVRDPRDNVRSILNRLEIPGTETRVDSTRVQDILSRNPGWTSILEGRNPPTRRATLMETLAERWKQAIEVYLRHEDELALVRYEDFCENKLGVITEVARRLGCESGNDIRPLLDRQFQPAGANADTWIEFFGDRNLRAIERICEAGMAKLGYPLR